MSDRSIYFTEEHELLRQQIRRFIANEVAPNGEGWEQEGMVPRSVLRQMGGLGLLGIRYPQKYGGSELDTLATIVLAEELGRSTFGGFAILVTGQQGTLMKAIKMGAVGFVIKPFCQEQVIGAVYRSLPYGFDSDLRSNSTPLQRN